MAKYEYELSALEGMGLTDVDLDSAVQAKPTSSQWNR
jgi:hypothetical protein